MNDAVVILIPLALPLLVAVWALRRSDAAHLRFPRNRSRPRADERRHVSRDDEHVTPLRRKDTR